MQVYELVVSVRYFLHTLTEKLLT